jgi:site-specific DNA recombinase
MTTTAPPRQVRVAVYTRKSVTDGLDQAFNSLDAQRQAIEAYVTSQAGLGWTAIPTRYDDGGFSGANTERPAFQALLRDIEDGQVDVVAVYKIDRLSRSLRDFAKLIDLFEKRSVTFVSVTQQFSTANSMGRLTLNILMSFAEFEREVIGERIRDKMQATRRRGMWTGGRPVLGYDVVDKKLVVNADEALQVRETFRLFLQHTSLRTTVAELKRRGWRNKTFTTTEAKTAQGGPFTNTTLHALLTNSIYTGQIRCGSDLVQGAHEAIVDTELWEAAQHRLRSNARNGGATARNKTNAMLRGLVRCGRCGSAMLHTFSTRDGKRTRYYTCARLHNEGPTSCPGSRVPAGKFEVFVTEQIMAIGTDKALLAKTAESVASAAAERAEQLDGELRRGEQERRRLETQLGDAETPAAAAAIDDRLQALARRQDEVRAERQALAGKAADADLREALAGFTPVWEHLFPRERERILRLLIEQVTFNPDSRDTDLELRPCGIATLANEARSTP